MANEQRMVAILPCNDLDAAQAFFARLGFTRSPEDAYDEYRILSDGEGADIHLTCAVEGWVVPGRNPFGLYFYVEEVDAMAARFVGETIEKSGPEHKPWGMYEFSLNGPDDVLVRVGWASRLLKSRQE
jgi:hypothetical protein